MRPHPMVSVAIGLNSIFYCDSKFIILILLLAWILLYSDSYVIRLKSNQNFKQKRIYNSCLLKITIQFPVFFNLHKQAKHWFQEEFG